VRVSTPSGVSEPQIANAPGSPCADDARTGPGFTVGGVVSASALTVQTHADPGGGRAQASVADLRLTVQGIHIKLGLLEAQARSFCSEAGTPRLTGSSSVGNLRINGGPPLRISGPVTLPLGPVTLYLNRKIVSAGEITQRAVEVNVPGATNVVLAEAVADVERCVPPTTDPPVARLEIARLRGRHQRFGRAVLRHVHAADRLDELERDPGRGLGLVLPGALLAMQHHPQLPRHGQRRRHRELVACLRRRGRRRRGLGHESTD
jgi:hypothetical protein